MDTTLSWVNRLCKLASITSISQELVRFDVQQMQHPEIRSIAYQQGTLQGYEVREYLLEKWGRECAYCGVADTSLETEHIVSRSRAAPTASAISRWPATTATRKRAVSRSRSIPYLTPLRQHQHRLAIVEREAKCPLCDAAAVNATRWALYRALQTMGLPVEVGTGERTRFNRQRLGTSNPMRWTPPMVAEAKLKLLSGIS